jgi:uncharacterized protein (TIGR02246 family)
MRTILLLVITMVSTPGLQNAQTEAVADDRRKVEAVAAAWQEAWNRHDIDMLASLVAEDVDFVTVVGPAGWQKGREVFKKGHAAMHETAFRESVWSVKETRVKFIRPEVAILHMIWETKGDRLPVPGKTQGALREGIFTWVLERRGDTWLVVAAQNTEAIRF